MNKSLIIIACLTVTPVMGQTAGGIAQSGHFSRFADPRSGEAAARIPDSVDPCAMVVIWRDGVATIDWACVDSFAAKWSADKASSPDVAWGYALKAVHEGLSKP